MPDQEEGLGVEQMLTSRKGHGPGALPIICACGYFSEPWVSHLSQVGTSNVLFSWHPTVNSGQRSAAAQGPQLPKMAAQSQKLPVRGPGPPPDALGHPKGLATGNPLPLGKFWAKGLGDRGLALELAP